MTMLRSLIPIYILATSCLIGARVYAAPKSDVAQLRTQLPTNFERQVVSIFAATDFAHLRNRPSSATSLPDYAQQLATALSAYQNLRVFGPKSSQKRLRRKLNRLVQFKRAKNRVRLGQKAFEEVRLADSARLLGEATTSLIALRYHLIEPDKVAAILVMRGQAYLESKKVIEAQTAFSRALQLAPAYRLNRELERPELVNAFEQARIRLLRTQGGRSLSQGINFTQELGALEARYQSWTGHSIYLSVHEQQLEVVIDSPFGVQIERQALSTNTTSDIERLASRIHATIPFGQVSKRHLPSLFAFDIAMTAGAHAATPVGLLPNYGVAGGIRLRTTEGITLRAGGLVALSNRDFHEHLRENVVITRTDISGGYEWSAPRFMLGVNLGVQLERLSAITMTTNPACKYFSSRSDVPSALCDFDSEVDSIAASWSVGPMAGGEVAFALSKRLWVAGRIQSAVSLFKTVETDFDWPFTVSFGVSYNVN